MSQFSEQHGEQHDEHVGARRFAAGDEVVERTPMPDIDELAALRIRDAVHDRFAVLDVQGDHLLVASVYTTRRPRLRLAVEFVHADLAEIADDGTVVVAAEVWADAEVHDMTNVIELPRRSA